jgi:DNA-directed RNA polymerase specialized sigma subunit
MAVTVTEETLNNAQICKNKLKQYKIMGVEIKTLESVKKNGLTVDEAHLQRLKNDCMAMGEAIAKVEDGTQRVILTQRYLQGLNFKRIARNLNYSNRQILRIHAKALDSVSKYI